MTVITMSRTEIDRMSVLQDLAANRIKVTEAATLMSLGRRQVSRSGQGAAATWPEESYVQGRIDGTPGRRVARSGSFTRRPPTERRLSCSQPSDISNWRKS